MNQEAQARSPLLSFIQHYSRFITSGLLIAAIGVVLTYRMVSKRASRGIDDFFQAELEVEQIANSNTGESEAFARLMAIIDRHTELHQKYDGVIAQSLLKQENAALGQEYADQVLARTRPIVTQYANFSDTSFLIARHEYTAALEQAHELQGRLDGQQTHAEYGQMLRLHNLLRIAFLTQETGTPAQERDAWLTLLGELKALEGKESHQQLLSSFSEGRVTLLDYADARLAALGAG